MPSEVVNHSGVTVGPDSLLRRKNLAAHIGVVAAIWSQLEVMLGWILSDLLSVEPEVSIEQLNRFKMARARSQEVRRVANLCLSEVNLNRLLPLLNLFDELADQRNKIVHGAWGTADSHPDALLWCTPLEQVKSYIMIGASVEKGVLGIAEIQALFPKFAAYDEMDFILLENDLKSLLQKLVALKFEFKLESYSTKLRPQPNS